MIIAISMKKADLNEFDSRFGRAGAFLLHDSESNTNTIVSNPAVNASGGAGVQASQFLADKGVQVVVSGAFGPSAFSTLEASEISMFLAPTDQACTAEDILEMFSAGKLQQTEKATGKGRH